MIEKKERFYNIDFLRFVGIFIIVIYHMALCAIRHYQIDNPVVQNFLTNTVNGGLWVNFFFIISGFFLFYTTDFSKNFMEFFKKKVFRFLPVILFAILLYMILSCCGLLTYQKYVNIYTALLINNIGLTTRNGMGNLHPCWFVSALFWAMMFYYALKNLVNEKWFNFITAHIVAFSYVLLTNASSRAAANYWNFLNNGFLRALAGLGAGYFIYLWYQTIRTQKFSWLQKGLISAAEIYFLIFLVNHTLLHQMKFWNFSLYILFFIGLVCCFLTKQGILSKILDYKYSSIIGRYTYSIFVTHIIVLDLINVNIWKKNLDIFIQHPYGNIAVVVLLSILLGIITYHLIEQPAYKHLNEKLKKGMVVERERERVMLRYKQNYALRGQYV